MNTGKALLSGLAGAVTLTAVNQGMKAMVKDAPKVDILGKKGVKKLFKKVGLKKPKSRVSYIASLVGDLVFNTLYYSLSATGRRPLLTGLLLGTGAGTGTVASPKVLNFGNRFEAKNTKQKALTMLIYLAGGLAAAGTYKALKA